MRVLMMLIPGPDTDRQQIVRLETVVEVYYAFRDAALEVVLASPGGGFPFLGPAGPATATRERFRQDHQARDALTDMLGLDQLFPDDFDAALCIGSPGPIWGSVPAAALLAAFLASGRLVAILSNELDLAPNGTARGLLVIGNAVEAPVRAAYALIGALGDGTTRIPSELPVGAANKMSV